MRGFWVAAGFCAHGIAGSGGMGRLMAEWIIEGQPGLDTWEMDSRRFGPQYRSRDYALERTTEVYATYYDVKYPGHERRSGRPLRLPPAHPRLVTLGACFGEKGGLGKGQLVRVEHDGRRRGAATRRMGRTALVAGRRGRAPRMSGGGRPVRRDLLLQDRGDRPRSGGLLGAHVRQPGRPRPPGTVTYTQLCNPTGGVECDLTVTRLREDRFRLMTGTAFGNHDLAWLRAHRPSDGSVLLEDVTSRYACFALWGPNARTILQPLTDTDLSNEAFGYMRARELSVGPVPCLALRVTYVGELGWELYCPSEFAARLFDALVAAGEGQGLVPGGYKAIESLRLEKGYRVWGSDVTAADTPFEAGLGFAVRLDKETPFIGREALARGYDAATPARLPRPRRRPAPSCSAPSRCASTARPWAG